MDLVSCRKKVNNLLLEHERAKKDVQREKKSLDILTSRLEAHQKAQAIVQLVAQSIQQKVHQKISGIVTLCLEAVFDNPYQFAIRFDQKRGKTEARMVFIREGVELDDPLYEVGGGVIDVTALALMVSCILLHRPELRRFMCLDEPWKNIRGEANKARTRELLEKLVSEMGFQVVINTDIKEYQLGQVIQL